MGNPQLFFGLLAPGGDQLGGLRRRQGGELREELQHEFGVRAELAFVLGALLGPFGFLQA